MATLLIVRASDGAAFPLQAQDIQGITSLSEFQFHVLSPLLEMSPESMIPMNQNGGMLKDESVLNLVAIARASQLSQPHSPPPESDIDIHHKIYIFDRDLLGPEAEQVAISLTIEEDQVLNEPPLNPEDPISAHVALSLHNLVTLRALLQSIALQRASLQVAIANLVQVIRNTNTQINHFTDHAHPSLESWTRLLDGMEPALEAINLVPVIPGLNSRSAGHARGVSAASAMSTGRDKDKVLGEYVRREKMVVVRDECAKVLAELTARSEEIQTTLELVATGAAQIEDEVDATGRDLEDLHACEDDGEAGHAHVEQLVAAGADLTDPDLTADNFEELAVADAESRDRIRFLVERKNAMTRYLVASMQRVSGLQSDIADIPRDLGVLDYDFKTRTDGFKHLARLDGLIPAYVATVAEVVRRREFARLLVEHSSGLSQALVPLSAAERTRRVDYRANHGGKLPWEIKGLAAGTEESVPQLDLTLKNDNPDLPELDRDALQALRASLDEIDVGEGSSHPIELARTFLGELVEVLDAVEAQFESLKLAAPAVVTDSSALTVEQLTNQLRQLEDAKEEVERGFQSERTAHEEELAQLSLRNSELAAARDQANTKATDLTGQLAAASSRSKTLEKDLGLSQASSAALLKDLDQLRSRLHAVERERAAAQADHSAAKATVDQLTQQAVVAEAVQKELNAALADKDKLLRDQRGEADLDRAVLEKELAAANASLERRESELRLAREQNTLLDGLVNGLREQNVRWETTAAERDAQVEAAKAEVARAGQDKEVGIVAAQKEVVQVTGVARSALRLAGMMAGDADRIGAMLTASSGGKGDSPKEDPTGSPARPTTAESAIVEHPSAEEMVPSRFASLDYDAGELADLLREVSEYEPAGLSEAVRSKVDSLSSLAKKWVKEAKTYRERAHRATAATGDKIAFRNFAKGDLALFLPTRNSTVPVWAAFNVSSPHHFLAAAGTVAEQIKTREWVVARIAGLTERVADPKDAGTNPYGLPAGTKYFLLEVEAWSSREGLGSRARKHSSVEKDKDKGKERRRVSRSESNPGPPPTSHSQASGSMVLVETPRSPQAHLRRTASDSGVTVGPAVGGLPANATAAARSEFEPVKEEAEGEGEVEAVGTSRPPSPTTLRQPVPRSEEMLIPSRASGSPSALTRSLARSPADPFAAGPFATAPASERMMQAPPSPPRTEYESVISGSSTAPAFLPARSTAGSSPRYGKALSASGAAPIPRASAGRKAVPVSGSPASTTGSFVAFPRSASSGSSLISASMMHRRTANGSVSGGGGGGGGGAGAGAGGGGAGVGAEGAGVKSLATSEAQLADSRWNILTEDLAAATRDQPRVTLVGPGGTRRQAGTAGGTGVGTSTRGFAPGEGNEGVARSGSMSMLGSVLGGLGSRRGSHSSGGAGGRIERWGASQGAEEIRKRLQGGGGGAGGR